jgi:hypothetical protein
MMDTIVRDCLICGYENDCIEGICLGCRLKRDSADIEKQTLQIKRDENCDNDRTAHWLRPEHFKPPATKPAESED